ncbi:LysR family transcriptional regulator [Paenibacillus sp. OAE614]|uniref:LysR family transcriptional regulator n=1 Tax=Paenibacillus sp. OAE614 TaxID=2663804 RepID=UPI001789187C
MNIDQLSYVVEVARVNSLAEAAGNLHITQSAISQAITSLEHELGLKLFKRSRLGTFPTAEGQSLIKKMTEAAKMIQEIRLEAEHRTQMLNGELRLATMPAEMAALVKVISLLRSEHPGLQFEISEKGSKEIISDIRHDLVDLGFVGLPESMLRQEGLAFEAVYTGKLMIAVPRISPLAARKSLTPAEVRGQWFALYKDDYVEAYIKEFTRQFGPVQVLFKTNNGGAVQSALQEGLAVTVGHDYSFYSLGGPLRDNLVMLDVEGFVQEPVHFGWIWSESRKRPAYKYIIDRFKHESRFGGWRSQ